MGRSRRTTFLFIFLLSFLSFVAGFLFEKYFPQSRSLSPIQIPKEKPLEKYSLENLAASKISPSKINIEANLFSLTFSPTLDGKNLKKVTGTINIPQSDDGSKKFPLILMLRGFVDQESYASGMGTKRAGEYFSQNGFIAIAPDFLGYGGSDKEADNIFETRFQTYTTVLSLLSSLGSIPEYDGHNLFLWGHSNGGQIALTLLEITGQAYPTTLWAPVTKPFPYSILYYTDEAEDKGRFIRSELAKFEADYDVEDYSLDNYLDRIKAPLQIHQGTADDAVPVDWSKQLSQRLDKLEISNQFYLYPGADHNLQPAWDLVVKRDLDFFTKAIR